MNVIEKILAAHCSNGSQGHVRPGMIVEIAPDLTMANDATAVLAIDVFNREGIKNHLVASFQKSHDIVFLCKGLREEEQGYEEDGQHSLFLVPFILLSHFDLLSGLSRTPGRRK